MKNHNQQKKLRTTTMDLFNKIEELNNKNEILECQLVIDTLEKQIIAIEDIIESWEIEKKKLYSFQKNKLKIYNRRLSKLRCIQQSLYNSFDYHMSIIEKLNS